MTHDPFQPHCAHYSMEELQAQIRDDIARQCFSIRHVLTDGTHPPFTYTVGLHTPGSPVPELFMSGLSMETRVGFMLHLGFLMIGPPPLEMRQRMARENGARVEDLAFPPGGVIFEPGRVYWDYTDNGLPTTFGPVARRHYEDHLGQATVFHNGADFPTLQVVWCDAAGIFPWAPNYSTDRRFKQELLFDPLHMLT